MTIHQLTSDWMPISIKPDAPCTVVFYSHTLQFYRGDKIYAKDGEPFNPNEPYRNERLSLGYWDGETWRELRTGHEVWEFQEGDELLRLPTHWMRVSDYQEAAP